MSFVDDAVKQRVKPFNHSGGCSAFVPTCRSAAAPKGASKITQSLQPARKMAVQSPSKHALFQFQSKEN